MFLANTCDEAIAIIRKTLKTAQFNRNKTAIAATKGGQWIAVAYKGSEGWMRATSAQQQHALPAAQFPEIPPTALEIYCRLRGWSGGTIFQAMSDLRQQGASFRDRLLDELPAAEWDTTGVDMLLTA